MFETLLVAILASVTAGASAVLLRGLLVRNEERGKVLRRLRELAGSDYESPPAERRSSLAGVQRLRGLLWRAGVEPALWHAWVGVGALAAVAHVGWVASGPLGASLLVASLLGGVWLFLHWRTNRRRAQILDQLPIFLDHVIRAVHAGSSAYNALTAATQEAHEPLRGIFERVSRQIGLGMDLDTAMEVATEVYSIRELDMLTLTIRVNQRYGGSIRDVLQNVIGAIRLRERVRREFNALTGETRLSAWLLGLLPAAICVYIVAINPEYIQGMWIDPAGRVLLGGAVGMQLFGSFLLWRMVKSV